MTGSGVEDGISGSKTGRIERMIVDFSSSVSLAVKLCSPIVTRCGMPLPA